MQIESSDLRDMTIKSVMFFPVLGSIIINGSKHLEGFVSPAFWQEIRSRLWNKVPICIFETATTIHGPNANKVFRATGQWVQYGPLSWVDGMALATVKEDVPFAEMSEPAKMAEAARMAGRVRIMAE